MLRLAYLNSQYPSLSHTFIEREVRALRERGVEVTTFSVRPPGASGSLGERHGAEARATIVLKPSAGALLLAQVGLALRAPLAYARGHVAAQRLSAPGLRARVASFAYAFEGARLAREMRRRGLSHVHVHMANNGAAVALLACRFDPSITYSMTIHGSAEFFDVHRLNLKAKAERAVFVRCISDFCHAQVMAWTNPASWDRFHVVRCGVDAEALAPGPARSWHELRLLTVGRLEPIKGYHVLLDACAALERAGVPWTLEMVGDGRLGDSLRQRARELDIADRVRFTGPVPQERLSEVYERSDALVVSSFMEGVPVVLMEAMSKGLLVVSTRVGGVPELVGDGVEGRLVPPASAGALAGALLELARDAGRLQSWRDAARARVVEHYNVAHLGEQMEALFRRYLGDSNQRGAP